MTKRKMQTQRAVRRVTERKDANPVGSTPGQKDQSGCAASQFGTPEENACNAILRSLRAHCRVLRHGKVVIQALKRDARMCKTSHSVKLEDGQVLRHGKGLSQALKHGGAGKHTNVRPDRGT